MTNSKQHFRDIPDQDLAEWRLRPPTVLLAASLSNDSRLALQACASLIQSGESHPAAWQAGWASCAETIAFLIMEKHDKPETTERVAVARG